MFEVESLKYATLATVSRCGMVWFSDDAVTPSMLYRNYLSTIRAVALDATDEDALLDLPARRTTTDDSDVPVNLATQRVIAARLEEYFDEGALVPRALEYAATVDHIMDFTTIRAITTLFSLLNKTIRNIIEYNAQHADFPLQPEQVESYVTKRLVVALVWAFTVRFATSLIQESNADSANCRAIRSSTRAPSWATSCATTLGLNSRRSARVALSSTTMSRSRQATGELTSPTGQALDTEFNPLKALLDKRGPDNRD